VSARRATAAVLAGLALAAVLLAPDAARACAVCAGKDSAAVSWAMLKGTALLSLLPLGVIGTGVWYLRRRARQLAAAEAARSASARAA
jgi:hypothetical protein